MLKKVLVTDLIRDGGRLVHGLEQQSFPISAALWYYLPEAERWRLVIASQFVDSQGPMAAYVLVQRVLATLERPTLLLSDVSVVSPHGADFRDLCLAVGRMPMTTGPWHTEIQNVVFEDAYIYLWPNQQAG